MNKSRLIIDYHINLTIADSMYRYFVKDSKSGVTLVSMGGILKSGLLTGNLAINYKYFITVVTKELDLIFGLSHIEIDLYIVNFFIEEKYLDFCKILEINRFLYRGSFI